MSGGDEDDSHLFRPIDEIASRDLLLQNQHKKQTLDSSERRVIEAVKPGGSSLQVPTRKVSAKRQKGADPKSQNDILEFHN